MIGRKRDSLKSKSGDGEKQEIWSYLLDNASKGKRLPEKSLIVMGICQSYKVLIATLKSSLT